MLDDQKLLEQRDPSGALALAGEQFKQTLFDAAVQNPDHDGREIRQVVVAGMGGSALAALMLQDWLSHEFLVPFTVVRTYELPAYVNEHTLVISSSVSGNTEETLTAFDEALRRGAQVAVLTSGGELLKKAIEQNTVYIKLPGGYQPRMTTILQLKSLTKILTHFSLLGAEKLFEIENLQGHLREWTQNLTHDVSTAHNYAKKIALLGVGKTPIFYAGPRTAGLAYKFKISWNENAKNVAFWNQYPEFNHNEFMGWASHPVDKPFAIFSLVSRHESPRIAQRFELSDKLLSGLRPKSNSVYLGETTVLGELLAGCILADFASIYTAILNQVDPTPVALIERLKSELAQEPRAVSLNFDELN